MMMTEDFLHYLWRSRLLQTPLFCVSGEPVMVIHPGEHNRNGGPDFINARVQIGRTLWAGNVEIHLRASDWFRHMHHKDPAYQNVILHVVDTCDKEVVGAGNQPIPVLEIRRNYPTALTARYKALQSAKQWVPCQNLMEDVDPSIFRLWAPALVVERLVTRTIRIRMWLNYTKNRWDELGYQVIASAMGSKINTQPFELLARSIPLKILLRHRDQVPVLEGLLFGQAGLLDPSFSGKYPKELLRTYNFYKDKYSLKPLEKGTWKFLRLRPVSFPTIRISQFAEILHQNWSFHESLQENLHVSDWKRIYRVKASRYWDSHYTFGRESASRVKWLGTNTIHLLLINGIVPLLFLYGTEKGLTRYSERALSLLEEIPGEKNSLVTSWSLLGMPADNALFTQALKQLKSAYCDRKRCLDCRIGAKIFHDIHDIHETHEHETNPNH